MLQFVPEVHVLNRYTSMFKEYLRNGRSSGDNLLGFVIDVESYLEMSGSFCDIDVSSSDDANCLVLAKCNHRGSGSSEEVSGILQEIWLNSLRYQDFEIHKSSIEGSKVTFDFCTTSGNLGVTGKIEVEICALLVSTDAYR